MNHLVWYLKVNFVIFIYIGLRTPHLLKVGSAVRSVKPGDRVAMEPGVFCRRCEACRTGRYQVCDVNLLSQHTLIF